MGVVRAEFVPIHHRKASPDNLCAISRTFGINVTHPAGTPHRRAQVGCSSRKCCLCNCVFQLVYAPSVDKFWVAHRSCSKSLRGRNWAAIRRVWSAGRCCFGRTDARDCRNQNRVVFVQRNGGICRTLVGLLSWHCCFSQVALVGWSNLKVSS